MDVFGWFIANGHLLLGHDKIAAVIGATPGDKSRCVLCAWEANPCEETRQAVEAAIGQRAN